MKTGKCKAIAASTLEQCSKKALPGGNYCWHHYPKGSSWVFVIIGAVLSFLFQIAYDKATISDEEQRTIDLTEYLKPFVQLAESAYPDLEADSALYTLRKDFETLKDRVSLEKNTLREMETKLTVSFSGNWKSSPASIIPISLGTPVPHYIELIGGSAKTERIKYVASQLYTRKAIDDNHIVFESRQTVPKGNYPLGHSIMELRNYDKIRVIVPLDEEATNFDDGVVLINRVEIDFFNNGRLVYRLDLSPQTPFQAPVRNRNTMFECILDGDLHTLISKYRIDK